LPLSSGNVEPSESKATQSPICPPAVLASCCRDFVAVPAVCCLMMCIGKYPIFNRFCYYGHPVGRLLYFAAVVSIFLSFFPLLFSVIGDGCLPYLQTRYGLRANLECMCEMYCTRLAENTGQKLRKILPSAPRHTTSLGYIFAIKACVNYQKKLVKQQYLLHMSSQYDECRCTTAVIGWRVWGTPADFNGFCVLALLLHQRRSVEVNQLCTMFGRLLGWYTIYTFLGALAT